MSSVCARPIGLIQQVCECRVEKENELRGLVQHSIIMALPGHVPAVQLSRMMATTLV